MRVSPTRGSSPAIILLLATTPLSLRAASCPGCGRSYGPAMPGDAERVEALRRDHEATCSARPVTSRSGSSSGGSAPAVPEAATPVGSSASDWGVGTSADRNRPVSPPSSGGSDAAPPGSWEARANEAVTFIQAARFDHLGIHASLLTGPAGARGSSSGEPHDPTVSPAGESRPEWRQRVLEGQTPSFIGRGTARVDGGFGTGRAAEGEVSVTLLGEAGSTIEGRVRARMIGPAGSEFAPYRSESWLFTLEWDGRSSTSDPVTIRGGSGEVTGVTLPLEAPSEAGLPFSFAVQFIGDRMVLRNFKKAIH